MKRVFLFLLCSFTLTAFPALGGNLHDDDIDPEDLLVKTKQVDSRSFRLTLANLQQENTRIILENLSGSSTYFSRFVRNHNGYSTLLNLSKLPDGKYALKVSQNNETLTLVIAIKGDQLLFSQIK